MILVVNFGGPRSLPEVRSFLTELLTDPDVIQPKLPGSIHRFLFSWIARIRSSKTAEDYEKIGGRSPIYFDTEQLASLLAKKMEISTLTFHRYLPETHKKSIQAIEECAAEEILVVPLFPQFSYATTGSIARFFSNHLSRSTINKLRWVSSYAKSPEFIASYAQKIQTFLAEKNLQEMETALLFSAHGLPKSFIKKGDPYEEECLASFEALRQWFPNAVSKLSFQSKFGPTEWLKPYTEEVCEKAASWVQGRKSVVIIPLSFTSDHIETLFEIQFLYLPLLEKQGLSAYRCPALNLEPYWIDALATILQTSPQTHTDRLYRNP